MKLVSATFGTDKVDGDVIVETGTFEMRIEEVALLAVVFGKMSPREVTDRFGAHIQVHNEIYDGATDLIHAFYEGGLNELIHDKGSPDGTG